MKASGMRATSCRIVREPDGFTLVELLVATVLALVVIGGAVTAFSVSTGNQTRIDTQAQAIGLARTAMEQMIRELRQGSSVSNASASQLSIVTYVDSTCAGSSMTTATQCQVTYACAGGTCTRRLARPDGTSPTSATRVVSGLASNSVFSYSPSATAPSYVGVTLSLPAQTGHPAITLSDGAALRNRGA
jgi:prepilin-type N-terminal cleavage/methylation domain-containing protein